jgi:HD superfamily phosphodiesterase
MMKKTQAALEMIKYYAGDVRRIEHFIKVHGYAKIIGESAELDERTQEILEVTAYMHDVGIKISEEKYNSSSGYYQQIEGPAIAEEMLSKIGYDKEFIDRVCYLISRHHKYNDIDGMDCQILIESDFIVNVIEDEVSAETVRDIRDKIFKTESGKTILDSLTEV